MSQWFKDARERMANIALAWQLVSIFLSCIAIIAINHTKILIFAITLGGLYPKNVDYEITASTIVSFLTIELVFLLIYSLYKSYRRYERSKLLNQNLRIYRTKIEYIQETETIYKIKRIFWFEALVDGANCFQTWFKWDGSESDHKVRAYEISSNGKKTELGITKIDIDDQLETKNTFAVVFHNMKKHDLKNIEIECADLSDAKKVVSKKIGWTFSHKDSKELILRVVFLSRKEFQKNITIPTSAFYGVTKNIDGYPKHLDSISDGREALWFVHEEHKLTSRESYIITWKDF
jgi:hypothetical protein